MVLPSTGFETRGKTAPWTTFAEEATYIDALLGEVPQIRRTQAGVGSTGLPIWYYRIGTGATHVFFLAQQHGAELSGREALLSRIRDWATSTDPAIVSYLSNVTLVVIPTARPDSQTSRNNVNGVNLNRDHVQITQAESIAYQSVVKTYKPVLIVDVHEGQNITNDYATSKALNVNITEGLRDLSAELEQAVKTAIEGQGYTWEPYQNWNITGAEYFENAGGLRHAVSLLLESRRVAGDESDAEKRYTEQLIAIDQIISWHAANLGRLATASAESRTSAEALTFVELVVGTNTSGPQILRVPSGYILTPAQASALANPINVFGLTVTETADGLLLSAKDGASVFAHYLANIQSEQRLVDGSPVLEPGTAVVEQDRMEAPYPRYQIMTSTGIEEVQEVRMVSGGNLVTIWP